MTNTQKAGVALILGGGAVVVAGELIGVTTNGETITGWTTSSPFVLVPVLVGLVVLAAHFVQDFFRRRR